MAETGMIRHMRHHVAQMLEFLLKISDAIFQVSDFLLLYCEKGLLLRVHESVFPSRGFNSPHLGTLRLRDRDRV